MADIVNESSEGNSQSGSGLRSFDFMNLSSSQSSDNNRTAPKGVKINDIVFRGLAAFFIMGMGFFLISGSQTGGDIEKGDETLFTSEEFAPIGWVDDGGEFGAKVRNGTFNQSINGSLEHISFPDTGKVFRSEEVRSDVGIVVYTPPTYEENESDYPVVYFLHGAYGSEWSYFYNDGFPEDVLLQTDNLIKLIDNGEVEPMIVVFANGGPNTGYINSSIGNVEDMYMTELIPFIDTSYRTYAFGGGRAIQGFSMGGSGSLYLAAKYPNEFSSVVSMSSACWFLDLPDFVRTTDACNEIQETTRTNIAANSNQIQNSLSVKLSHGPQENINITGWNKEVYEQLASLGVQVQFSELDGARHKLGEQYQVIEYNGQSFGLNSAQFHVNSFDLEAPEEVDRLFISDEIDSETSSDVLGQWNFDDIFSEEIKDASGISNPAFANNGASWIEAGKSNGGLKLDGLDDFASVDNFVIDDDTFSISFWVNHDLVEAADQNYIRFPAGVVRIMKSDNSDVEVSVGTNKSSQSIVAPSVISPGIWNHIALVSGDGSLKLYVNGDFVDEINVTGGLPPVVGQMRFGDSTRSLNGIMDEVIFFSRTLEENEIKELATN